MCNILLSVNIPLVPRVREREAEREKKRELLSLFLSPAGLHSRTTQITILQIEHHFLLFKIISLVLSVMVEMS